MYVCVYIYIYTYYIYTWRERERERERENKYIYIYIYIYIYNLSLSLGSRAKGKAPRGAFASFSPVALSLLPLLVEAGLRKFSPVSLLAPGLFALLRLAARRPAEASTFCKGGCSGNRV